MKIHTVLHHDTSKPKMGKIAVPHVAPIPAKHVIDHSANPVIVRADSDPSNSAPTAHPAKPDKIGSANPAEGSVIASTASTAASTKPLASSATAPAASTN
jgi:hypothetical protein